MSAAARKYLLLFLGAIALVPATQSQKKPEGEALLDLACVQCHDLAMVASQRKTAAAWRRTINEMVWRGAPLLRGESEILAGYLAATFGPESRQKTPGRTQPPAGQKTP